MRPYSDAKDGWFRPLRRGPQGLILIGDGPGWVSVAGGVLLGGRCHGEDVSKILHFGKSRDGFW